MAYIHTCLHDGEIHFLTLYFTYFKYLSIIYNLVEFETTLLLQFFLEASIGTFLFFLQRLKGNLFGKGQVPFSRICIFLLSRFLAKLTTTWGERHVEIFTYTAYYFAIQWLVVFVWKLSNNWQKGYTLWNFKSKQSSEPAQNNLHFT